MHSASSVRQKLFLAIFGPSFLVLAIVGCLWILSDAQGLRRAIEREAILQASILARAAERSIPADDRITLNELLSALSADRDVVFAAIYSPEDEIMAEYRTPSASRPRQPAAGRQGKILSVVQDISSGTQVVGRLLVQASLASYYDRLRSIIVEATGILVMLTLGAAIAANTLRTRMLKPLESLAATARNISEKKDYSVRAAEFRDAEFQTVTTAFNQMLREIEKQDSALNSANAELREANRELEAFTYSVSHDLRTPLRAISSYAQILARSDEALPPKAEEYLGRIHKNAAKMAQLIDDLLAFSRVDAQPLEHREVDLTEVASQAWQEIASQNKERLIEYQLEPLGTAHGDPALLYQVFSNLFSNAVKYTRGREPAKITVGRLPSEREKIYYVRDNGVGFDMKYVSKLFGVFQRLHSDKEFEGTGVGLAIVQRIIDRHEGRIWAEATPGQGATFYFTLNE